MSRPKIKIRKTGLDLFLEILTGLLIICSVLLIWFYYDHLSEKIPIDFNWPTKDRNGYGTKKLLWTSPIICGILAIGIYILNHYPWLFNYPIEITEKNAQKVYKLSTQMLRVLSLIIGIMCFTFTLTSVLKGLGKKTSFDIFIEPLFPILLIGLPIFFLIRIIKRNRNN
jgi:cytochrome bd-type quinol oxidase subunit 2